MTENAAQPLIDYKPTKEFFIGIDSDGCAFDTMELKQKECFIPNIIKSFGLQAVSKYVRESAEFVNLYSAYRGFNRFPALMKSIELTAERPEVIARGIDIPKMPALRAWLDRETKLGTPALVAAAAAAKGTPEEEEMDLLLSWNTAVNKSVEEMCFGIPPFPLVRESLEKAQEKADMIVVSGTPSEALEREWAENDIAKYVHVIAGQEMGKKGEHLTLGAVDKGFAKDKMLMMGDALGDLKAAREVGAMFFPIKPGQEDKSWELFHNEGLDRFFNGDYAGDFEAKQIEEFLVVLPEIPPWKK